MPADASHDERDEDDLEVASEKAGEDEAAAENGESGAGEGDAVDAGPSDEANTAGDVGGGVDGDASDKGAAPTEDEPYKKSFDMFDLDQSGEISACEFGTVMRSLGQNPTDEDIENMLKVSLTYKL